MKYLNNKTNGNVIRITKVSDSAIYYSIFENSVFADKNEFAKSIVIAESINDVMVLEVNKTLIEVKQDCALQIISDNEPDFTIENDEKNWYITKGSTGIDTSIRLFIPNMAYDSALADKDNPEGLFFMLWQVISFGTTNIDAKFSQITYNSIILYLEELLPEHKSIIEMYADFGVLIEYKN